MDISATGFIARAALIPNVANTGDRTLGKLISIAFLTHSSSVCLYWKVFGARDPVCYINVYHLPYLYFQSLAVSLNAITGIIAHTVVYILKQSIQ